MSTKKVNKLHENVIMCNILCYHTMLSYQTTSFALLRMKFQKSITASSLILSIYVLSILGFVLLQRSIITYVSFLNFANLHLPVSLTCSFQ